MCVLCFVYVFTDCFAAFLCFGFVDLMVMWFRRVSEVNATGSGIETICGAGNSCESNACGSTVCTCGRGADGRLFGLVYFKEITMTCF